MSKEDRSSFLKNHMDTLAIIGVNLAIAIVFIGLYIQNCSAISRQDASNARQDAANARMDKMHTMFYDLLREVKNKEENGKKI